MSRYARENRVLNQSITQRLNQHLRDDAIDGLSSLGFDREGVVIGEGQIIDNTQSLAKGTWGGFTLQQPDTTISSMSNGTLVDGRVTLRGDCVIEGVHFKNSDKNLEYLVEVTNDAVVRFIGCAFEKNINLSSTMVTLTSGKIIFIGCLFKGSSGTTGFVVDNVPAVAADIQAIGCYNKAAPGAFGTATNVGSFL